MYVEGYRRYEYHYLKTLLERESARIKGNKTIDLHVVLLDADADAPKQDRTLLPDGFPTPFRNAEAHTRDADLWSYDVVILGDLDPEEHAGFNEHLKNVAEFVRERGGGLLVMAGPRHSPTSYKNTPLKDVLPIDVTGERAGDRDPDEAILETYRAELTPAGKMHPDLPLQRRRRRENEEVWARLKEFYWYADGYEPKRAAEVLAMHPTLKAAGKGGRAGAASASVAALLRGGAVHVPRRDETWRWNWREDQAHYNQFWIQTIRYLARSNGRQDRAAARPADAVPARRADHGDGAFSRRREAAAGGRRGEGGGGAAPGGREGDRETLTLKLAR